MLRTMFLHKGQQPGLRLIKVSQLASEPVSQFNRQTDKPTNRQTKSGQVAIESTIAIVAIIIFLLGATQTFLWVNRSQIKRQRAYQQSRTELGMRQSYQHSIDFYDAKSAENKLYVFPQERP